MNHTPDHILRNRALWNAKADEYAAAGRRHWSEEPSWGIWSIPESELRPPATATTRYPFVTLEWARRWPCEEAWVARRR